ncbi:hypothetical protein DYB26_000168 [Aphanomyces astaci]|uniref:PDZ domain-containing protein n=2 Tax=Aphanomyces astaci TaxID=112090 RepID=A0A397D9X4_APHAT|nr:hypothetical protein DYB38_000296 [Aphanomyces astaci]RHY89218.1 hypothetical protein DYB26_000168 [Aphanomyces astaci]
MSSRHRGGYDEDEDDDMLLKALQMSEPCGNCGKPGAQIPCMSGCGEVFYCSRVRRRQAIGGDPEEESSDESYDDDSGDGSSDEELRAPPPTSKGGKSTSTGSSGNGKPSMKKKESGGGGGGGGGSSSRLRVDSDVERRIEEKIMRRLKKQEENRIAQAIEAQMAQANANWTDADMNRIAMEVKNRLQKEMGHMFMNGSSSRSRKNSITRETLLHSRQITSISEEQQQPGSRGEHPPSDGDHPATRSESTTLAVSREVSRPAAPSRSNSTKDAMKQPGAPQASSSVPRTATSTNHLNGSSSSRNIVVDAAPMQHQSSPAAVGPIVPSESVVLSPTGPPSAWNNKCDAFLSLKIVVWKLDFLPQLKFGRNDVDGSWNKLVEVDADESFSHIDVGDLLMSLNGQHLSGLSAVGDDQVIQDMLAQTRGGHVILKFSTTKPVNVHVKEYSVRWGNGPLGLTLKDDGSPEALPIVHRLTRKPGSVAVKENIAIGDVLCAINNIDTVQLGCALTMSVLKKVQLPATLTFRGVGGNATKAAPSTSREVVRSVNNVPQPPAQPTTPTPGAVYTVNWTVGPLGLTIIPGLAAGELPVIKRVTGKGESVGIESAQVGDFLLSVNSKSVASLGFETIVDMMKSLPKPIVLEFRSAQKSNHVHSDKPDTATRSDRPTRTPPAPVVLVPQVVAAVAPTDTVRSNHSAATDTGRSNHSAATSTVRNSPPHSSKWLAPQGDEVDIDVPVSSAAATYSVVWGADGPLGLTIDAIPHATGAFIKRSNRTGAASHLSEDCIGDEMTHINDIDMTQMDYNRIVTYLRKVPRPVTLRFKKDSIVGRDSMSAAAPSVSTPTNRLSSSRPATSTSGPAKATSQYDLAWTEGSLGLSLHAADDKSEFPYITRVTGVGCAAHLPSSVVGDQLRYINAMSCHSSRMTFNDIMEMLKSLPKPIQLRFHKGGSDDTTKQTSSLAVQSHTGNGAYNGAAPSSSNHNGNKSLLSTGNGTFNSVNGSYNTGGDDDNATTHNMLTPFAGAPKLSTGRRQKIVKQLKK